MHQAWTYALAFMAVAGLMIGGFLLAARLLGVRSHADSPLRRRTYECGEEPEGPAWVRFHPRYYVIALFFVLFDVEAAFLMPWATALDRVGAAGLIGMAVFIAIVMLGWFYALKKGALKWQ